MLLAPFFRFHLSPERELLLAHLQGILVLLLAFFAFRFFLHSVLKTIGEPKDKEPSEGIESRSLPEWSLCVLGYSLFLWSSLIIVGVSMIGPDLLVTAFVYLAAALLLRLHREHSLLTSVAFGLTLGAGYWAKAIMFPISLVFLAVSIFKVPRWKQNLSSVLAFALVAAPLVLTLSLQRGRFTFGDSGLLNYSAMVSPGGRVINWQGNPVASGVPKHPTRQIAVNPPTYEFNGPIQGTYPPSYDPSYWNEGRRATFNLRSQLSVFLHHVPHVAELFLVTQPSVTAGFLFLLLWSSNGFLARLSRRWDLLTMSLSIVALYMMVHFEQRFAGAFVVLIWMSIFLSLRLPASPDSPRIAGFSIVALSAVMLLSFASDTAKKLVNGCPESAQAQLEVAHQLLIPPDTPVAVVGPGNFSYWAHFARLRIIAEIMSPDDQNFWRLSSDQRQQLYDIFRKTGAQWIIGQPPLPNPLDAGWERIGTTTYYRYQLHP
jgi:ABC-type molybdate transport system permease subunit